LLLNSRLNLLVARTSYEVEGKSPQNIESGSRIDRVLASLLPTMDVPLESKEGALVNAMVLLRLLASGCKCRTLVAR
jgi:hypothetical protein